MSKTPKVYTELVFFKGDMDKDGAPLRIGEIRILMKAIAELCEVQYSEDDRSFAIFGLEEKLSADDAATKAFAKQVLAKIDLCGNFGNAEIEKKTQKVIDLAKEKNLKCGIDTVVKRAQDMIMSGNMSLRNWII